MSRAAAGTSSAGIDSEVTGTKCAPCVTRDKKTLQAVPGFKNATVNLATKKVTALAEPSVTTQTLTVAVRKAGVLYNWGLGQLVLVSPVVDFILHPLAGPVATLLAVKLLVQMSGLEQAVPEVD
jgi:copper chaperone CopZ